MGTAFGNIIGLVILIILIVVSFFFPYGGAVAFVSIMYVSWALVLFSHLLTMPKNDAPLCMLLLPDEVQTYKMFHLAVWFPDGAAIYSSILNLFRMAGIIWGALCLWNEMYYLGGAMLAFFFVSSGMIVKHNPYLYLADNAKDGNAFAMNQMAVLQSVIEKRDRYNRERNSQEDEE